MRRFWTALCLVILALTLSLLAGGARSRAEEGRDPNSRGGGSSSDGKGDSETGQSDESDAGGDEVVDEGVSEEGAAGDESAGDESAGEAQPGDEETENGAGDEAGTDEPSEPEMPYVPGMGPDPTEGKNVPKMPTKEEVLQQKKGQIENYIPVDYKFRIGLICDFNEKVEAYGGEQSTVTKSPLLLIDPRTGGYRVGKDNFPARIIADSPDGKYVIAVAPSSSVDGTSGASNKEAAISLNLPSGQVKLLAEFPLHSNFQAFFAPGSSDKIYYCVNEPGVENKIISYNLQSAKEEPIPAEGNRFKLYGPKEGKPKGIWVQDPLTLANYPVASLLDLKGNQLDHVEFPGTEDLYVQPGGETLLATVMDRAEASLGYYSAKDKSFHQIPDLVISHPSIKWCHNSHAVVVKEATNTHDRFLWIDLDTNQVTELTSVIYKVKFWDISPQDDALVLVADTGKEVVKSDDPDKPITIIGRDPLLSVIPIGPDAAGKPINSIKLTNISNLQWMGCMYAYSVGGNWFDKFFPKGIF